MATERLNFREKKKTLKNLPFRSHIAVLAVHLSERCGQWASVFFLRVVFELYSL